MTSALTLAEALAEMERTQRELDEERAQRQRLEDELKDARRLEALGRMAGSVAHDFSNILAVISGHSELMLKRMDPTDSLRTGAESIRKAAVWGLNLTRHVMATTRSIGPSPELIDLNVVIASVVRTLQPLLGERIDMVLRLEPRLGRVNVNVVPLEQAIMNLLLNARDAMPMGGRITVETGHLPPESGNGGPPSVMLRVIDTGFGMDAATLSRAFEPYFTTKAPGRGTGLGLATVFAFVSQSGGRIDATSEVGRGSTFTLALPQAAEAEAPPDTPPPGTATVLVVEPEAGVRELISEILELHGYHVLAARDLDEALGVSLRHSGPIALSVADLLLPGMAGDGLVSRLGPRRNDMKVLYLSSDIQSTIEEYRGLSSGRGFLHKPFTVDALVQKVADMLGASSSAGPAVTG
jgi:nitrogen-specific signal transduction histidine kinase/CheY-like chemotaxis protein